MSDDRPPQENPQGPGEPTSQPWGGATPTPDPTAPGAGWDAPAASSHDPGRPGEAAPDAAPAAGGDAPGYGAAPTPGYGAPAAPTPGYGSGDSQGYAAPATPAYGSGDSQGYGAAPTPGYDPSAPGYAAPAAGYDAAAQGYGAPAAGYDPAAAGAGAYGTPPNPYAPVGTPPKKRRTGLLIGLIAGGLVIVAAIAVGAIVIFAGGGPSPKDTVKDYLQALSDGDATKALAQGTKPADTSFVTDATLKAQQGKAKISGITVDSGITSGNRARVTASYTFGDKHASDEQFALTKVSGKWKLDDTTYPIDLTDINDIPGLTLFGVDATGKDKAYVFPGPLAWGSANDYFTVTEQDATDFTLSPYDANFSFTTLETDLSDKGKQAVGQAVSDYISGCAASKELEPANCPQAEFDYTFVDGTATWTAPSDLSALQYQTGSDPTQISVNGDTTWHVTYTSKDFDGNQTTASDDVDVLIYGTVDLSKDKPTFSAD